MQNLRLGKIEGLRLSRDLPIGCQPVPGCQIIQKQSKATSSVHEILFYLLFVLIYLCFWHTLIGFQNRYVTNIHMVVNCSLLTQYYSKPLRLSNEIEEKFFHLCVFNHFNCAGVGTIIILVWFINLVWLHIYFFLCSGAWIG